MSCSIKVAVRVKPTANKYRSWIVDKNDNRISKNGSDSCNFSYDYVFSGESETNEIYDLVAKEIVHDAINGTNGTIIAYGQTGSGKTFTMTGIESSPGIIPLAISDIFHSISNTETHEYEISLSYFEIYNEKIRDLLVDGSQHENKPRLTNIIISSPEIMMEQIYIGETRRMVGSTLMNEHSSRSHAIVRIIIESRSRDDDSTTYFSSLDLVDLAGSECIKQTEATGERQREASMINKSLLALSKLIDSLIKKQYPSYRDSKLTMELKNSLGGNAKTAIITTISNDNDKKGVSENSLRFASNAMKIKNKPTVNKLEEEKSMVERLQRTIWNLEKELKTLKEDPHSRNRENESFRCNFVVPNMSELLSKKQRRLSYSGVTSKGNMNQLVEKEVQGLFSPEKLELPIKIMKRPSLGKSNKETILTTPISRKAVFCINDTVFEEKSDDSDNFDAIDNEIIMLTSKQTKLTLDDSFSEPVELPKKKKKSLENNGETVTESVLISSIQSINNESETLSQIPVISKSKRREIVESAMTHFLKFPNITKERSNGRVSSLTTENQELKKKIAELETENKSLQEKVDSSQPIQLEKLDEPISVKDQIINELTVYNHSLESQLNECKGEKEQLESILIDKSIEIEEQNAIIEALHASFGKDNQQMNELSSTVSSQKQLINELQAEIASLLDKHHKEYILELEAHSHESFAIQDSHQKELLSLKDQHEKEMKHMKETFHNQIDLLNDEHENEIVSIRNNLEVVHKCSIDQLKQEISVDLKKHNQKIQEMKKLVDEKEQVLNMYSEEIQDQDQKIKLLEAQLAEQFIENEKLHKATIMGSLCKSITEPRISNCGMNLRKKIEDLKKPNLITQESFEFSCSSHTKFAISTNIAIEIDSDEDCIIQHPHNPSVFIQTKGIPKVLTQIFFTLLQALILYLCFVD